MNNIIAFAPLIVLLLVLFHHHHTRAMPVVMTVEDCVFNKWRDWENIWGEMPSQKEEKTLREECWTEMGATINADDKIFPHPWKGDVQ